MDIRIQKDSWDGSTSMTVTVRDEGYRELYSGVFTIIPDEILLPEIEYNGDGRGQ